MSVYISKYNMKDISINCTYEELLKYQSLVNKCYFEFENQKITLDDLSVKLDELFEDFIEQYAYDTTERY
jgi:hypothetical protein